MDGPPPSLRGIRILLVAVYTEIMILDKGVGFKIEIQCLLRFSPFSVFLVRARHAEAFCVNYSSA